MAHNDNAATLNAELMPLIATDHYTVALLRVQALNNPIISILPKVAKSHFTNAIGAMWDSLVSDRENAAEISTKRLMAVGAARRICQLELMMDSTSPLDDAYIVTAQRRGLLLHTRKVPSSHQLAVQRYDGTDAWNRLEAVECLTILANLFVSTGVTVPGLTSLDRYCREPYYRLVPHKSDNRGVQVAKMPNPNRRFCADLAYIAYNFRACASVKHGVIPPLRMLRDSEAQDSANTFTAQDFRVTALLTDDNKPLQVTLSYIAGKLLQFKALGENVRHCIM